MDKRKYKVLHIASFGGNVGDLINHNGFYRLFDDLFDRDGSDRIEIRDFYYSAYPRLLFDQKMLDTINKHDMVVFGGGNFFDCRWEGSRTGTTLDMSQDFISRIKVPVLVNCMGYDAPEFYGMTNLEVERRFETFIRQISECPNWFVSFRNDESYYRITQKYPWLRTDRVHKAPDCAFYNSYRGDTLPKNILGLNVSHDLFRDDYNGRDMTINHFDCVIANFIKEMCSDGWSVRFFLHTPQDIYTVAGICRMLPDKLLRSHITIATMELYGDISKVAEKYISSYAECGIVVGMRFHACVSGLIAGVPTIALAGHSKMESLYRELGLSQYCIRVMGDFGKKLYELCTGIDEGLMEKIDVVCKKAIDELKKYRNDVEGFISSN